MKEINVRVSVNAPGEKVWEVLADYGGFLKWAGGSEDEITVEGEGIGMVRHLKMSGAELAERLTVLDPGKRILGYQLDYGEPIGMKEYKAHVQVVDAGAGCEIIWRGEFTATDPGQEVQVGEALSAAYDGMTGALVSYLDR
ncbi:MAG: SRPBCC family protein [Proteobacteria bacterium]|nr:SRPBCC family protein [Pseudomonadota bacterium]